MNTIVSKSPRYRDSVLTYLTQIKETSSLGSKSPRNGDNALSK